MFDSSLLCFSAIELSPQPVLLASDMLPERKRTASAVDLFVTLDCWQTRPEKEALLPTREIAC